MSVKIRLRRVGAKKQPSYRVVVADSHSPRDGRFIEAIGFYNPRTKPTTITIDEEKARKWLGNGALPTESVASLLYRAGIVDMRSPRWRERAGNKEAAEQPAADEAPAAPAARKGRTPRAAAEAATSEAPAAKESPAVDAETPAAEVVAPEETPPDADATTES